MPMSSAMMPMTTNISVSVNARRTNEAGNERARDGICDMVRILLDRPTRAKPMERLDVNSVPEMYAALRLERLPGACKVHWTVWLCALHALRRYVTQTLRERFIDERSTKPPRAIHTRVIWR